MKSTKGSEEQPFTLRCDACLREAVFCSEPAARAYEWIFIEGLCGDPGKHLLNHTSHVLHFCSNVCKDKKRELWSNVQQFTCFQCKWVWTSLGVKPLFCSFSRDTGVIYFCGELCFTKWKLKDTEEQLSKALADRDRLVRIIGDAQRAWTTIKGFLE